MAAWGEIENGALGSSAARTLGMLERPDDHHEKLAEMPLTRKVLPRARG